MRCNPVRWLWGLLPLALVTLLTIAGTRQIVEADLQKRAEAGLIGAGYYWANPSFSGRDVTLEGISFSAEDRDGAVAFIKELWGTGVVTDAVQLIASSETYKWLANRRENRVELRGYVPTEDDRRAILGIVKAGLPGLEIDDKTALAGGAPKRDIWLGSVSFAIAQLARLKQGVARLNGPSLHIEGEASDTSGFIELSKIASTDLPAGLKLEQLRITPPRVQPYEWRVKFESSNLSFDGYAPDNQSREFVMEQARNMFPGATITDGMELASGAPKNWSWAASASLSQLNRLKSGRIKMKDTVIEFEGIALTPEIATHVTSSIRNSLPSTFLSSEKIVAEEPEKPAEQQ